MNKVLVLILLAASSGYDVSDFLDKPMDGAHVTVGFKAIAGSPDPTYNPKYRWFGYIAKFNEVRVNPYSSKERCEAAIKVASVEWTDRRCVEVRP